jgi:hypothetical protein
MSPHPAAHVIWGMGSWLELNAKFGGISERLACCVRGSGRCGRGSRGSTSRPRATRPGIVGDRAFKLGSGTTSEPGRYVKSLGGVPSREGQVQPHRSNPRQHLLLSHGCCRARRTAPSRGSRDGAEVRCASKLMLSGALASVRQSAECSSKCTADTDTDSNTDSNVSECGPNSSAQRHAESESQCHRGSPIHRCSSSSRNRNTDRFLHRRVVAVVTIEVHRLLQGVLGIACESHS